VLDILHFLCDLTHTKTIENFNPAQATFGSRSLPLSFYVSGTVLNHHAPSNPGIVPKLCIEVSQKYSGFVSFNPSQLLGSSSSHTSLEDEPPNKMHGRRSYLATPVISYVGSIIRCSKDGIHESYVRLTSLRFLITLPLYYLQSIQIIYWVFHLFLFFKIRTYKHWKTHQ